MSGLIVPFKGFVPKVASSAFIAATEKDFETFKRFAAGYVALSRSYVTDETAKAAA